MVPAIQYVKLFLELKETKRLYQITKLIHGSSGNNLKKKKSLDDIKDIFDHQNEPYAEVIIIMGGPGEY